MSQLDVQNILTGLAQAQTRKASLASQNLEQQRLSDLKDFQDKQIAQHQAELAEQHSQFLDDLKLHQAASKVLVNQANNEIAERITRGLPVVGASTPSTAAPLQNGFQQVTVPTVDPTTGQNVPTTMTTQTPEAFAGQEANLGTIRQAPQVAAKIAENAAAQEAETKRMLIQLKQSHDTSLAVAGVQQAGENYRSAQDRSSKEKIALYNMGIGLPPGTDSGTADATTNHVIGGIADGSIPFEDIEKYVPNKAIGAQLLQHAQNQGFVPLTRKQTEFLQAAAGVGDQIPNYLKYLVQQRNVPMPAAGAFGVSLGGLGNNALTNPDAQKTLDGLQATSGPAFAKLFAQAPRGANIAEIKSMSNFVPNPKYAPEINAKGVGELVRNYNNVIKASMDGLSDPQKALISTQYGFDKWKGLEESLSAGKLPNPDEIYNPLKPKTQIPQQTPGIGQTFNGQAITNVTPIQ